MRATPKIKIYKKAIPILFVAFALVVGACSHSSQSESPPAVTLSDTEWERVTVERGKELEESQSPQRSENEINDLLGIYPHYGFTPDTPEWNTAVVREAEMFQSFPPTFNKCFRSLDVYYDFEKLALSPIEKAIEFNQRYFFAGRSIFRWIFFEISLHRNNPLLTGGISSLNLSEEEQAEFDNLPTEEIVSTENFGKFYEAVYLALADVIGGRNLHSLAEEFAYETLPELKNGYASIGFESSESGISQFQDIWGANPEIERIVRIDLERIEQAEAMLEQILQDTSEITSMQFGSALPDISDEYVFRPSQLLEIEDFLLVASAKQPPAECPQDGEILE